MLNAADGRSSICGGVLSYFIYCFAEVERFLPHPLPFIQPHLIRDHCNELRIGGLSAQIVDGIAEVAVQSVHIAPVPRHLDGMADGALHRLAVVPFFLAISGYSRFVTALMYSGSFIVRRMASRRN